MSNPLDPSDRSGASAEPEASSASQTRNVASRSDSNSLFVCPRNDCSKIFTRAEHLSRHVRAHQNNRPFICEDCGKGFTRQDVLSRHQKQHTGDPASKSRSSPPAKRAKIACRNCAAAKTRCDGTQPCSRCAAGLRTCIYIGNQSQRKATTSESDTNVLSQGNDNLEPPSNEAPIPPDLQGLVEASINRSYNFSSAPSDPLSNVTIPLSLINEQTQTTQLQEGPAATTQTGWQAGSAIVTSSLPPFQYNAGVFEPLATGMPIENSRSHSAPDLGGDFLAALFGEHSESQAAASSYSQLDGVFNDIGFDFGSAQNMFASSLDAPLDFDSLWPQIDVGIPSHGSESAAPSASIPSQQPNAYNVAGQTRPPERKAGVPPLQHGLRTRANSPTEPIEEDADWLANWNPIQAEGLHDTDVNVDNEGTAEIDNPPIRLQQIDETARLSIIELLRYTTLSSQKYHALYVRLTRISLSTLNHYMLMYFRYLHPYVPWIHLPSFDPKHISGFLLGAIVSLGAQFSPVAGSKAFSHVLGDIVRLSIGIIVHEHHSLVRELELGQAMVLWGFLRYSGVKRLMELSDAFRMCYIVALEKMHVFSNSIALPAVLADDSVSTGKRWLSWRAWEERRRTGFACFLSDAELTVFLGRPAAAPPADLRLPLPCDDELWEAASPDEWISKYKAQSAIKPSDSPNACQILEYGSKAAKILAAQAQRSSFSSVILIQMLAVAICNMRQAGVFSETTRRYICNDIRKSLLILMNSSNEFLTVAHTANTNWRAVSILYHMAHVSLRVPLSNFLSIAGRNCNAQIELANLMRANPTSSRETALHAGQCLRIITESTSEGSYELFCLFYTGLVLYAFASVQEQQEDTSEGAEDTDSLDLDRASPGASELEWVNHGGLPARLFGHLVLCPSKANDILQFVHDTFKSKRSWGIAQGLATVINRLLA